MAARATNGLPGDHGLSFKYYSIYQHNLPRYNQVSGHESCRAAGGRTYQHLRSPTAIARRHQKYNNTRAQNRRAYRLWNANNKEWRSSTLVPIPVPPKKVHVSNYAQRRNYPRRIMTSISFTRASLFKTYVKRDRLYEPQARLDNFAPPNRRMTLYSWNLESLLGVGKTRAFPADYIQYQSRYNMPCRKQNPPRRIASNIPKLTSILAVVCRTPMPGLDLQSLLL